MSRKRHKPEEIVAKRRQGDVLTAQGTPVADAVRSMGVTEVAPGRAAGWRDRLHAAGGASGLLISKCPRSATACYDLSQSRAAARERTPMKEQAVFS